MVEFSVVGRRFTYIHDCKWPSEAIDTHHVAARNGSAKCFFVCLFIIVLLANTFYLFLVKDKYIIILLWNFLLSAMFFKLMLRKLVVKESVVIIPAFGVQLETHYMNGSIIRRFVPINKILKPVLVECVTPVTCYWSLSLILFEEAEVMLVFKNLRPPVKMLVPIWKALCLASGIKDSPDKFREDAE